MTEADDAPTPQLDDDADARRKFLQRYGSLAIVAPAVGLLLSTSLASPAIAASGGKGGGGGRPVTAQNDAVPQPPRTGKPSAKA